MLTEYKEESGVKDNWDDEELDNIKDDWDEPDPEPAKVVVKAAAAKVAVSVKPVKDFKDMTVEEKKQAQIEADFKNAKELFGLEKSLDEVSFDTKEDYKNFISRLDLRLSTFHVS